MSPRLLSLVAASALVLGTTAGCELIADPSSTTDKGGANAAPTGDAKDSLADLNRLTVAKAGTMARYSRDKFPHWRDTGSNCDVRDTVLKRDGTKVKVSGCNVVAGAWTSVYDGKELTAPTQVDIDHVVPLANAWRSGAAAWDTDKRSDFANDTERPQLVAVSQNSNRSKGDQDPSTWKPTATANWCEYSQDWIAVKTYWKLSVTTAEKTALKNMLEKC